MQQTTITNLLDAMRVTSPIIERIDQQQKLTALESRICNDLYTAIIARNHQIEGVLANKFTIGYFGEYILGAHNLSNGENVNHLLSQDDRRGNRNFLEADNISDTNVSLTRTVPNKVTTLYVFSDRIHKQGNSTHLKMIDRINWDIWSATRTTWEQVASGLTTWKGSYQVSRRRFLMAGGTITPLCDLIRTPLSCIK